MHIQCLEKNGYFVAKNISSIEDLILLTNPLGELISPNDGEFQRIAPSEKGISKSRSFSYFYGLNEFPLHTDTSYWDEPARYILFYALEASDTYTSILNADSTQRIFSNFLTTNPIFCSKKERGTFYESPWISREHGHVKYDPCYMKPANSAAASLAKELMQYKVSDFEKITWDKGQALVIDNWRCLHGRGSHISGLPRTLVRIYRKRKQ